MAAVHAEAGTARADLAVVCHNVRIGLDDSVYFGLFLDHAVERDVFRALGPADNETGVLDREEAFGNGVKQIACECDCQQRYADGDVRMTKDMCQRPLVASQHSRKATFERT